MEALGRQVLWHGRDRHVEVPHHRRRRATIKCRYSDIRFQEDMPRIQTCNAKNLTEWCDGLGSVAQEDKHAVLRRCVFVEVTEHIVPKGLQKQYIQQRRENCYDKLAAVVAQQGANMPCEMEVVFRPM